MSQLISFRWTVFRGILTVRMPQALDFAVIHIISFSDGLPSAYKEFTRVATQVTGCIQMDQPLVIRAVTSLPEGVYHDSYWLPRVAHTLPPDLCCRHK